MTERTHIGKYRINRQIGKGGMAIVYDATDETIGRRTALKVLHLPHGISDTEAQEMIQRFQREARSAGRLSHPNIVTIYEVGCVDGEHFIAMEYLDSRTAKSYLDEHGRMPPQLLIRVLRQLADALDYAHAAGVIHRDVKPDNIALMANDHVKLTDFGIARLANDLVRTQAGVMIGSPAYMSPEQITSEEVGPQSDIWSLAVTAWELLSGQKPFNAPKVAMVIHNVVYEAPAVTRGLSPGAQIALLRALDKDPSRRHPTARAFVEDLALRIHASDDPEGGGLFSGRPQSRPIPITSQPAKQSSSKSSPSVHARLSRLVTRQPMVWAGVAIAVLALAYGVYSGINRTRTPAMPTMQVDLEGVTATPVIHTLADLEISNSWQSKEPNQVMRRVRGRASQGSFWLKVESSGGDKPLTLSITPEVRDWRRYGDTVSLDLLVPEQSGLQATAVLAIIDSTGKRHTLGEPAILQPGAWVTLTRKGGTALRDVRELQITVEPRTSGQNRWFGLDFLRAYHP